MKTFFDLCRKFEKKMYHLNLIENDFNAKFKKLKKFPNSLQNYF